MPSRLGSHKGRAFGGRLGGGEDEIQVFVPGGAPKAPASASPSYIPDAKTVTEPSLVCGLAGGASVGEVIPLREPSQESTDTSSCGSPLDPPDAVQVLFLPCCTHGLEDALGAVASACDLFCKHSL